MRARFLVLSAILPLLLPLAAPPVASAQPGPQEVVVRPLSERIVSADPSQYRRSNSVHGGAGPMSFSTMFGAWVLESNLLFLHRGVIEPGGGIGHHFHNTTEEMFVILNEGEAEFTVDGRTSRVATPAGAPTTLGSSHAIRNHTDQPLEWLNINVSTVKGQYDAFDLDDPRVDVALDPIPVFMTMRLDRSLLRESEGLNGGTGTAQYRRALQPTVFKGPWAYADHLVLPAGASQGLHRHTGVEEFYYVIAGNGTMRVNGESAAVQKDDAIPIHLDEAHGIENTGSEPLELLIVGIATSMEKNLETIDVAP